MLDFSIPNNWSPRDYQEDGWMYFQEGGTRGCFCWHRRAGKDLFSINLIATKMIERPGLYWHCFPTLAQGRKIAWEGNTRDGRPFLDAFPGYNRAGKDDSLVASKRDDSMTIRLKPTRDPATGEMRETGGTYQVIGLDDPDTTVGPNPFGIVYSEWSLCPERAWHLHKPILNENGGWALFIFTMRGRNHAFDMLQRAQRSPKWFAQLLTVDDTFKLVETTEIDEESKEPVYVPRPVVTQEQIQEDRDEGVPEETIQSEYYGKADASVLGSYYGSIIDRIEKNGQIREVSFDPKFPVHTMWDIGHDSTAISPFQISGNEIHILNFYQNQGEGLPHYLKQLKKWENELGYDFEVHYGPHDLMQREFAGGGITKLQIARNHGLKFTLVKKHSLEDGIEETRAFLMRCWFDKDKCDTKRGLLDSLRAYHKEWDAKHECYKENPVHDWASHPADMLRQGAMGLKTKMAFKRDKETNMQRSKTDYNEYNY